MRYRDAAGKRRAKQFDKKADAVLFADTIKAEVRAGTHVAERDTVSVAKAADTWLEACRLGRDGREPVEASTLRQYRTHVRVHIVPRIGGLKLPYLTAQRAREFRDVDLLAAGVSRAMTKKILTSLSSLCGEAVARAWLTSNPCHGVTVVRSGRQKVATRIPTKDEVRRVLARAERWIEDAKVRPRGISRHSALRFSAMLHTIVATGMRLSEVRGASLADLQLDKLLYTVRQRADERCVIGAPKSAAGFRDLELSAAAGAWLVRWLSVAPKSVLVFPNGEGRAESMQAIYKRLWHPLLIQEGLASRDGEGRLQTAFSVHDLRHFHASLQIEGGLAAKELQVHMGHSSIQVTMDVYGHLFTDDDAAARRRATVTGAVDRLLAPEAVTA